MVSLNLKKILLVLINVDIWMFFEKKVLLFWYVILGDIVEDYLNIYSLLSFF